MEHIGEEREREPIFWRKKKQNGKKFYGESNIKEQNLLIYESAAVPAGQKSWEKHGADLLYMRFDWQPSQRTRARVALSLSSLSIVASSFYFTQLFTSLNSLLIVLWAVRKYSVWVCVDDALCITRTNSTRPHKKITWREKSNQAHHKMSGSLRFIIIIT